MRVPELLFPFLNRVVRLLLHSPAHRLLSGSVMEMRFTGRRTGKRRATPLRYLREDEGHLICFTAAHTGWWHNFRQDRPVELYVAGRWLTASARAWPPDGESTMPSDATERAERKSEQKVEQKVEKAERLARMLTRFPGDAAYHGIALRRGEAPSEEQVRQAASQGVLVIFTLA